MSPPISPKNGGHDADEQRLLAADEQPGQQVAAAVVGAERVARLRARATGLDCARTWSISGSAAGSCGAIHGEMMARTTNADGDAGAEQEQRVAPQPAPRAASSDTPGARRPTAAARSSMRALRRSP